eukprot:353435-Chlamydomonas_euryale.AAC.3
MHACRGGLCNTGHAPATLPAACLAHATVLRMPTAMHVPAVVRRRAGHPGSSCPIGRWEAGRQACRRALHCRSEQLLRTVAESTRGGLVAAGRCANLDCGLHATRHVVLQRSSADHHQPSTRRAATRACRRDGTHTGLRPH